MTNAKIQELIKKDKTRTLELKKIHGRVEGRDAHSVCLSEHIWRPCSSRHNIGFFAGHRTAG